MMAADRRPLFATWTSRSIAAAAALVGLPVTVTVSHAGTSPCKPDKVHSGAAFSQTSSDRTGQHRASRPGPAHPHSTDWPPHTVMTTLPHAWPALRYSMALGTSLSEYVLSTTGVSLPASISFPSNWRSSARSVDTSIRRF
jgi:hypothetical protein